MVFGFSFGLRTGAQGRVGPLNTSRKRFRLKAPIAEPINTSQLGPYCRTYKHFATPLYAPRSSGFGLRGYRDSGTKAPCGAES